MKTLYRSRTDRMVGGVCGGIAACFDVDPTWVRLGAVLLLLLTEGLAAVVYLVMMVVVPEEPELLPPPVPPMAAPVTEPAASPVGESLAEEPPAAPVPPAPGAPQVAGAVRGGRGGVVAGAVLIVLGAAFLVAQVVPSLDVWRLWPLVVIAVGVSIVVKRGRD